MLMSIVQAAHSWTCRRNQWNQLNQGTTYRTIFAIWL